jgi:hypothetical protein
VTSKQVNFFATEKDMRSLMQIVEAQFAVTYFCIGVFDDSDIRGLLSMATKRDLGFVEYPDAASAAKYLMLPAEVPVLVREVQQRTGITKYAVDQLNNPQSIVVAPGGKFKDVGIVAGMAGTVTKDAVSLEIYRFFSKQIRKEFSLIHSFYIGPEALNALDSGIRLAVNLRAPVEYDLAR